MKKNLSNSLILIFITGMVVRFPVVFSQNLVTISFLHEVNSCSSDFVSNWTQTITFIEMFQPYLDERTLLVLEKITERQNFCADKFDLPLLCNGMDVSQLSYHPVSSEFVVDGWQAKGVWFDKKNVEYEHTVPFVIKWQPPADFSPIENNAGIILVEDNVDQEWCLLVNSDHVFQAGVVQNLIPEPGFEQSLLPDNLFPWQYLTNAQEPDLLNLFTLEHTQKGDREFSTVACIQADHTHFNTKFGPGLYVHIPVQNGQIFLQSVGFYVSGNATASIGGTWETKSERFPQYVVQESEGEEWQDNIQLIEAPQQAAQFSFRIANWGDEGIACFDSLMFLPIILPVELLELT